MASHPTPIALSAEQTISYELADDEPLYKVIDELVRLYKLPTHSPQGQLLTYALYICDERRRLSRELTLSQEHVMPGTALALAIQHAPWWEPPPPEPEQPGSPSGPFNILLPGRRISSSISRSAHLISNSFNKGIVGRRGKFSSPLLNLAAALALAVSVALFVLSLTPSPAPQTITPSNSSTDGLLMSPAQEGEEVAMPTVTVVPFVAPTVTLPVLSSATAAAQTSTAQALTTRQPPPTVRRLPPARTATATPAVPLMPNLIGYGENQAKEILAGLGVAPEHIVVDYQSRSKLGDLFDQQPPFAVVSTQPQIGEPLAPGITVVLGIRSPEDDQPPVTETASPSPAASQDGI
ncbi:MAG: hypothetical protein KatS3mg057_2874 [Herpetosiphonaceae bacterium]|nr:MAG: hypothetical protein KatS3mg057_2874 [Herpetosiphonaceae bacterium]